MNENNTQSYGEPISSQEDGVNRKKDVFENTTEGQSWYIPEGIPAETPRSQNGTIFGVFSFVCALISVFFVPIVFGSIGVFLAISAIERKKKTLGIFGIVFSLVGMIAGLVLAMIFSLSNEEEFLSGFIQGIF